MSIDFDVWCGSGTVRVLVLALTSWTNFSSLVEFFFLSEITFIFLIFEFLIYILPRFEASSASMFWYLRGWSLYFWDLRFWFVYCRSLNIWYDFRSVLKLSRLSFSALIRLMAVWPGRLCVDCRGDVKVKAILYSFLYRPYLLKLRSCWPFDREG